MLEIKTRGRGLVEVTREVDAWVRETGLREGLLTVFCRHTSASVIIQENAAAAVRSDLEAFFEQIAPEDPSRYRHDDEGPDDMPSHIRTALTGVSLGIPLIGGRLALGTWQGVYLFEHRRAPPTRQLALHLIGE
ncbi:MAG TPA: secondary thiamine-phosphate synthase enzyme YjbQ [Caulobacteraceae bacterium]|nr:secondary thiamine-phosphate synthase enzyme YjbQ [Caulobacteraceae bacterium]